MAKNFEDSDLSSVICYLFSVICPLLIGIDFALFHRNTELRTTAMEGILKCRPIEFLVIPLAPCQSL